MNISCVMTTYGRFECVERSIQFFLNQHTTATTELIIYNTAVRFPLVLGDDFKNISNIKIINNNTDYLTGTEYNNLGSIRRDAMTHATGTYYICWDDDDIFLPWNIQQCWDGINRHSDYLAWKPVKSMWWAGAPDDLPEIAGNVMEASIISHTDTIRNIGYIPHPGGGEHLSWYEYLSKHDKIKIDDDSIPAYCFNWHDQGLMRGHKQSGTINRPDNFQYHKQNTLNFSTRPLQFYPSEKIQAIYNLHLPPILQLKSKQHLIDRYIKL